MTQHIKPAELRAMLARLDAFTFDVSSCGLPGHAEGFDVSTHDAGQWLVLAKALVATARSLEEQMHRVICAELNMRPGEPVL